MPPSKATKVMLVEDDPTMRSILRTLLEIEGFQAMNLPDHQSESEILASIKAAMPDVVLLDVHIHNVNGVSVLKNMRADDDLKNVRVIMSSGMDVKDQCKQAGANGFLLKPYMPEELMSLLRG